MTDTEKTAEGNAAESAVSLEEAFAQLEEIIRKMEEPDASLDQTFAEYERGLKLLKLCNDKIDRVEKQMIILRASLTDPEAEEHHGD